MKKKVFAFTMLIMVLFLINPINVGAAFDDFDHYFFGYYSSKAATNYASQYAKTRNSNYYSFSNDCTNFVSQCLYAGYFLMSNTNGKKSNRSGDANAETCDWYHVKCEVKDSFLGISYGSHTEWKVSTTFVRADKNSSSSGYGLFQFLTKKRNFSTFASTDASEIVKKARVGDIIQVAKYGETAKTHSVIVTGKTATDITISYHTTDSKNVNFITYFMPRWDREGFPITLIQLNGIYQ